MKINMDIITQEEINISFGTENEIDYDFGLESAYTGSYEATPRVEEQTLYTANKTMLSDIIIDPIPTSDVNNESGGRTFTIG